MSNETLLQLEQRLIEEAQPFAVVTVIRAAPPTSAWVGAQALVEGDGALHGWIGGGCSRSIVVAAALQTIRAGQPKRVRISNEPGRPEADVEAHAMPCASNGTLELFIQPTLPAPMVLILGSTPTALEACVLAQRVGLRVGAAASVTAPLAALGLPWVRQGFDAAAFDQIEPQLILVATQGDNDEDALEAALRSTAAAVLLVASERKADRLRDAMRRRGITPERLAALHSPAGPHIHARTPQEIALGAVAGLVTLRRELQQQAAAAGADASHLVSGETVPALSPCETSASIETPRARYLNPVCGMAVEPASAKHVLDYGGERVYFCCDGCKLEFERAPDKYLAIAQGRAQLEKT
ncbi:xanthine and CO dehydrogenases maturation factor, XdhC/CoxF family [Burkholderia sp. Ch1-1]|uniref:Xanthine and CO dehydrogenases maturation factor, XdhC/CoxF family n=1 Tax=Paraburkholderia dioscoreae TaxID=2604047 RepID=A0A5Q4YVE4_9BURK|nr:XdhC family protein [Paraburkholderia dioscoreae]EIF31164.1 xanthine and CO dehydrogenases maturation factor, XdhC/CoxF family [Burkholderia sp. Ch1-1]VVD28636.1 Xanthine and CO dehydrogenases maturation factor, XdhC/CoxF family [Paraburkholderia dioscoreae]